MACCEEITMLEETLFCNNLTRNNIILFLQSWSDSKLPLSLYTGIYVGKIWRALQTDTSLFWVFILHSVAQMQIWFCFVVWYWSSNIIHSEKKSIFDFIWYHLQRYLSKIQTHSNSAVHRHWDTQSPSAWFCWVVPKPPYFSAGPPKKKCNFTDQKILTLLL